MSTDQDHFQDQLETVYEQHRQQDLEAALDDLAKIMEETLLERVLAEEFLETRIEIDSEAKQAVERAREHLDANEYSELAEFLPTVREAVEEQDHRVSTQTHQARIDIHNTVQGMRRLNERVGRVEPDRLADLEQLLDSWDWEGHIEGETMAERTENASAFANEMRTQFEEAKADLFGPYRGTPLEELVDRLLDDERLTLAALSDEELQRLYESDLADYLEVMLS